MKKVVVVIAIVAFLAISFSLLINRNGAMAQDADSYIPGKKCKMCHIKIFKAHADSLHAVAFENVKDAGEATNTECLACHSTGYGKPGGFVDEASTPTLAGTTCQACHGPGAAHAAKGLKKPERKALMEKVNPKDSCVNCHKPHGEHADVGVGILKKKLDRLQKKIAAMEG